MRKPTAVSSSDLSCVECDDSLFSSMNFSSPYDVSNTINVQSLNDWKDDETSV